MDQYVDYAEYYDWDVPASQDVAFYLKYAQRMGPPILELACGTGRLLLPLAQAGFTVHGLDLSEDMLAVARSKIQQAGLADKVLLRHADMARFDMPRKDYAMAFVAFRSFMHLFSQEDQLACLSCVIKHLQPGGLFIVDVYGPSLAHLSQPADQPFQFRREFRLPNGHRVVRKDRFVKNDYVNQLNHAELMFEEFDSAGAVARSRIVPIVTRYSFRFELQLLLEKAGFQIESLFNDYEARPFDASREIIFVARKPAEPA